MVLGSAPDFRRAGVARYAYGLIDALADRCDDSHEFHVFVLPSFEVPKKWLAAHGFRIHRCWHRYSRWNLVAAGPIARSLGLDFYFSTAHTVPIMTRIPRGLMVHDLFPIRHPEWFPEGHARFSRSVLPKSCRWSSLVFANSEATRRDLENVLRVDPKKIVVTPLGRGGSLARGKKPEREHLRALAIPFRRYLLTVGTLEPRKNLEGLLRAFAGLSGPEAHGLGLVVAGGRGWMYERSLALIDELGLQSRVRELGYVPDEALPELYAGCELFVYPSFEEGFGFPIIEAMQAGAPVVCSRGGSLAEVGGSAARFFDPHDIGSIREGIQEGLNDPDRQGWIERGFRNAERFDWAATADLTLGAIDSFLDCRSGNTMSSG
jgi:alpha-1,3-rhamnosyl/mannosyltransferase